MSKAFERGKQDALAGRNPWPPAFWGAKDYMNGYADGRTLRREIRDRRFMETGSFSKAAEKAQ